MLRDNRSYHGQPPLPFQQGCPRRGLPVPFHPAAALAGGLFLTLADTLARALIAPIEIPVGVITALMGGPFFLVILRRRRHGEWSE
ncbi:MAG: iron chelate uptake ABC transporter family permease subunit [Lentisphaerae bacterium]|nr:iron chelate uptake ABC transporter family permease subunit [Lentisphaerota bacterium]